MSARKVTTQADLDQALADKAGLIEIYSPADAQMIICENGSSCVEAWESSCVVATEAATVSAFGGKVRATALVAVYLHSATVDVKGGVIIDHTHIKDMDGAAWCEYHGVEVARGVATLFKAVNDQWTTDRGTDYSPGSKPKCDDFKDTNACGNGLHFGPSPSHARNYFESATKYVAVGVRCPNCAPLPGRSPRRRRRESYAHASKLTFTARLSR